MSAEARDFEFLRSAAMAVHEGHCHEWEYDVGQDDWDDGTFDDYHAIRTVMRAWGSGEVGRAHSEADARFIAAADPGTVLMLLGEIDLLREAVGDNPVYEAAKTQLDEQRAANVTLEAQNDELQRRNQRLYAALRRVADDVQRCADLVAEVDADPPPSISKDTEHEK